MPTLPQEETYRLAAEVGGALEWLPYTLDIPSYLGRAELDETGRADRRHFDSNHDLFCLIG